jgi:hypothetical protein
LGGVVVVLGGVVVVFATAAAAAAPPASDFSLDLRIRKPNPSLMVHTWTLNVSIKITPNNMRTLTFNGFIILNQMIYIC